MSYRQLTREQRYQISALKSSLHTQAHIAAVVGVHQSTVSRELRRNQTSSGRYGPLQAHLLAISRRHVKSPPRFTHQTWARVEALLQQQWSPEQVTGRLRYEKQKSPSHEWIYQHIYADKRAGGSQQPQLALPEDEKKTLPLASTPDSDPQSH